MTSDEGRRVAGKIVGWKHRLAWLVALTPLAGWMLYAADAAEVVKPAETAATPSAKPAAPAGRNAKLAAKYPGVKLYDTGVMEDNEACFVCHLDFQKEKIASAHLEAEITCAGCHGDSDVHRSDESNVTRPDVIWGRAEVASFCQQCHKAHKDPKKVEAFHKEWDGKRRPNGRFVLKDSTCTDCHGKHAVVKGEGVFK